MLTRKAFVSQLESKLQLTLRELKLAKEECDKLYSEREDNERELLDTLNKCNSLRIELTNIQSQYDDIVEERNQLKYVISQFDKCSSEYESALNKITFLEQELGQANRSMQHLQTVAQIVEQHETESLYNELVNKDPSFVSPVSSNITTIDLTSDDTICAPKHLKLAGCSKNKLRKFIKLNKFIKKTVKLVKKQNLYEKNLKITKEKINFMENLVTCQLELEHNRLQYEANLHNLNLEITQLHSSLQLMTCKYENSLREFEEHTLAADELLTLTKQNAELFEALEPIYSDCTCNKISIPQPDCAFSSFCTSQSSVYEGLQTQEQYNDTPSPSLSDHVKHTKLVMFCDEIGKGMGHLLRPNFECSVINNCMPDCTYNNIMKQVLCSSELHPSTNLVVFIGNKNDLIKYFHRLSMLNVKNIVMFSFPYCKGLPQEENTLRYKLNLTMHTLSCNNSKFHLVDTNSIVRNIYTRTRDKFYLKYHCKKLVAMSLSYYFNITAKNLAKQSAFIEQFQYTNNVIDITANCLVNESASIEQHTCSLLTTNSLNYN